MNNVALIGRLTRDPEIRYTPGQLAVATFNLAIDRPVRSGQERQTDFPRVTVFGKQAENCERFLVKGRLVAISGRIQTGSYKNKNGDTVYTTDVVANRVEFLEWGDKNQSSNNRNNYSRNENSFDDFAQQSSSSTFGSNGLDEDLPSGFEAIEEDVPF